MCPTTIMAHLYYNAICANLIVIYFNLIGFFFLILIMIGEKSNYAINGNDKSFFFFLHL